jgi:steroid 5-alpha reductase family enzyme
MKDRLILFFIYIAAFSVGLFIGNSYTGFSVIMKSAMIVFATVLIIWLFSFIADNSSVFDPYWSVAPIFLTIYYWISFAGFRFPVEGTWSSTVRFVFILSLVTLWGLRLTYNFSRNWGGLKHEDWRYVDFRKKTGFLYWVVSYLGIHLFPAIMVFLGCLSIWVALTNCVRPMNFLDIAGILITGIAIRLEAKADKELHQHILLNPEGGKTVRTGLWAISRHPNYLGEITFWWGLYLFALAANPSYWWVIIGPVTITVMFVFISIPMIEKRLLQRKTDYPEYMKHVPMLIPFKFEKRK